MAFSSARVSAALWPEFAGAATAVGVQLVATALDAKMVTTSKFPIISTIATVGMLATSLIAMGEGKAPDFCAGIFWGVAVGILTRAMVALYEAATKAPTQTKVSDLFALIPRKVMKASAGSPTKVVVNPGSAIGLARGTL